MSRTTSSLKISSSSTTHTRLRCRQSDSRSRSAAPACSQSSCRTSRNQRQRQNTVVTIVRIFMMLFWRTSICVWCISRSCRGYSRCICEARPATVPVPKRASNRCAARGSSSVSSLSVPHSSSAAHSTPRTPRLAANLENPLLKAVRALTQQLLLHLRKTVIISLQRDGVVLQQMPSAPRQLCGRLRLLQEFPSELSQLAAQRITVIGERSRFASGGTRTAAGVRRIAFCGTANVRARRPSPAPPGKQLGRSAQPPRRLALLQLRRCQRSYSSVFIPITAFSVGSYWPPRPVLSREFFIC